MNLHVNVLLTLRI